MPLLRCGRTGRVGEKGFVTNFVCPYDATTAAAIRHLQSHSLPLDVAFTRKRALSTKVDNELEVGPLSQSVLIL